MTIQTISGGLSQKLSLKPIELSSGLRAREIFWLLLAGVIVTVLHEMFRWPIKMPGRHGLEWMAILIFFRAGSTYVWAASVVALGAASTSLVSIASVSEPSAAWSYLLAGMIVDALFIAGKQWRQSVFYLAIAAGLAHSLRPLFNLVEANVFGLAHHSLNTGLAYPMLTHLLFGFIGGLTGAMLALLNKRR
ncbi:MAG: hypothetical protein KGZ88_23370 [Methylomicrobium sp.]|nr:hypothetical protein [Methylomicrobium sp.]